MAFASNNPGFEVDMNVVKRAFGKDEQLLHKIDTTLKVYPQLVSFVEDIAAYHLKHCSQDSDIGAVADVDEPATKKRRLVNESTSLPTRSVEKRQIIFEAKDVSFSIPLRKKLHLNIVSYEQGHPHQNPIFGICLTNPATNEKELEVPLSNFAHVLRLPIPEKAQKQYNFCLIPKPQNHDETEAVVCNVNHGPLKSFQIANAELNDLSASSTDVLETALNFCFQSTGIQVVGPEIGEFASAIPESHRRNDQAYHVKAFRGSKDGFLFFLRDGIFFGFKKPLIFLAFEDIESISYTSVLQRTFNINVCIHDKVGEQPQEIEFAMLDQADFPGIDAYIKRHQLQDASMAEARRAKTQKSTIAKTSETNGEGPDTRTELEKAEAELEDDEDELEEDYDPGDEDDSDGSGNSSEDEDSYTVKDGHNLVEDELGSEAEEIEPDTDDENQL